MLTVPAFKTLLHAPPNPFRPTLFNCLAALLQRKASCGGLSFILFLFYSLNFTFRVSTGIVGIIDFSITLSFSLFKYFFMTTLVYIYSREPDNLFHGNNFRNQRKARIVGKSEKSHIRCNVTI